MIKPEPGQTIGGKYRLIGELGRGGMATVFEAENTLTFKRAAVKWLHPQFHDPGQGLTRVLREARAATRIRHENVVDVYDVVEEGSSVYLVMELLQGELLSDLLEREKLPMHELIALLVPAMRGVAAGHAAGVVHRDIKPENIFLAREGEQGQVSPKVIDFGISKVVEADPSDATRSGITMGTPRYASFEQLLAGRDVDARTDVYAFGVVLYEALTGCSPYGDAMSFAEQAVRFATRDALSAASLREGIPADLVALVQRAIAKHRDERTPSLEALLLELVPFADPGRYPNPLRVRSQSAIRYRATLAARQAGQAPGRIEALQRASARRRERRQFRRRGVALSAIGLVTMGVALLSLRYEAPRHSRASAHLEQAQQAGLAVVSAPDATPEPSAAEPSAAESSPPARPAPAAPQQPQAPPDPGASSPTAPAKPQRRNGPSPEAPASKAKTVSEGPLHRAGPLRRSEF